MKKFFDYRTGVFVGGAALGIALASVVGCGQAGAPPVLAAAAAAPATTTGATIAQILATVPSFQGPAQVTGGLPVFCGQAGGEVKTVSGVSVCRVNYTGIINFGNQGSSLPIVTSNSYEGGVNLDLGSTMHAGYSLMYILLPNDTLSLTASGTWDTGTSVGICSGQQVSSTGLAAVVPVYVPGGATPVPTTYASNGAPNVVATGGQLWWGVNPPGKAPACTRNVQVNVSVIRCIDANNNTYQCP